MKLTILQLQYLHNLLPCPYEYTAKGRGSVVKAPISDSEDDAIYIVEFHIVTTINGLEWALNV